MTSFAYPKTKHVRKESPPHYKSYASYRPYIEREFEHKCVYCRKPDSIDPGSAFGIDHYRPKIQFADQINDYLNLFYCCGACNSRKGTYWPKDSEAEIDRFIPNPCDHVMWSHLRFVGDTVQPHSEPGRFTADYLDLNDPAIVSFRKFVLDAIAANKKKEVEIKALRKKIETALEKGRVTAHQAAVDLQVLDSELQTVGAHIARLTGT